jgi:hexosaminidase
MVFRFLILLMLVCIAPTLPAGVESGLNAVVPQPMKMEVLEGEFTFGPKTTIIVDTDTRNVGEYFAKLVSTVSGFALDVKESSQSDDGGDCVVLKTVADKFHLGPEGYELKVEKGRILVKALNETGIFYGIQTLRQLLPPVVESEYLTLGVDWSVPCVRIEDKPRYGWRGLMLGPGHNFITKEFTKKYIDLLAYYKMNKLHLHLTDMGWAIEIKKYPELTNMDKMPPIAPRWRGTYGKCKYGFYSQADIRELVAYASEHFVEIIPEIELPSHACAALACYPELGCPNWTSKVEHPYSYFDYEMNYCAGSEKVFEFLEDVLSEVMDLFPSPMIHIGGDERRKGHWSECPLCQARMKAEGLENEDELQSYFVKRIEKFVLSKGRRIVGWSEIMEGGLAPEATVQSWLKADIAVMAANEGHDVIMSTNSHCYLDHLDLGIQTMYGFEPTPPELAADKVKHILGVEACIWGHPQHRLDGLVFPRLIALAEVGWSPSDTRNWNDFRLRLQNHSLRLELLGIDYHRDAAIWEGSDKSIWDRKL